jgi:hypothetical protein
MLRLGNQSILLGKVLVVPLALLTECAPRVYERIFLLESSDTKSGAELRIIMVCKEGMAVDPFSYLYISIQLLFICRVGVRREGKVEGHS